MSYRRVLPRDLFNESKLLKCLGQVVLLLHDGKIRGLTCEDVLCREGFKIEQNESDGSISVPHLLFRDRQDRLVHFWTPLNAKGAYPLVMTYGSEDYHPLNEVGAWRLHETLFLDGV